MSVLRVDHQKNYVVINKEALEDKNLSFKAKGLWAYCMSRPNDWEFHVSHLAKISKDGEDSIYSAIKELVDNGYCEKVQGSYKGRFTKVDYVIREIKIILPLRDFPDAVFPDAENPGVLSNECLPSIEKEIVCTSSPSAPKSNDHSVKIFKKNLQDQEIEISLQAIFQECVLKRKDWTAPEIHSAWKVLEAFSGKLVDPFKYIEGVIKNFRNEKKGEAFANHKEKQKCQMKEKNLSEECKEISSVPVIKVSCSEMFKRP